MNLEAAVAAQGLVLLGVCRLEPEAEHGRFVRWLEAGKHAGMAFLERHRDLRRDARLVAEGAEYAIVVGLPYGQGDRHRSPAARPRPEAQAVDEMARRPRIAQYARLRDYHREIWRRAGQVASMLQHTHGARVARVVSDSAPVLERAIAVRAGAGFVGKNTCVIHPRLGSLFLLGEILTDLVLPESQPLAVDPARRQESGGCGSCRRCQLHCPTGALSQDYVLDANLCLSYWTIENHGTIPERFWPWLADYLFGCDICQIVCPYNRAQALEAPGELIKLVGTPPLFAIATMDQLVYERMFAGTPVVRGKREGLMRNALIAMHVTGDGRLAEAMQLAVERSPEGVVPQTVEQIKRARLGAGSGS